MRPIARGPALTAGLLLVLAVAAVAFSVGGVHLPLGDLLSGRGEAGETARMLAALRLPRVLLAGLVGGCLALAGAAVLLASDRKSVV